MTLLQDLRYALRSLFRSPGFFAAAVLILALGIGANTAIFSVMRAVLLQPLPFREPERLAWVWSTRVDRDRAFYSIPNFRDTAAGARSFAELAAFTPWAPTLSGDGEPERLSAVRVTGNAFSLLGAGAATGRIIEPGDAESEAGRVAVISHGLWGRRFGADRRIVGKSVILNGEAHTIVGVLPKDFLFPGADDADLATPLSLVADPRRTERGSNFLRVFGRLADGSDTARAGAELASITSRLRELYPDENAKLTAPRVVALTEEIVGGSRRLLLVLSAAVALLLLVACANLAALFLVRGLGRRHEVAVRKALGAGPVRVVMPFLAEAALVAAAGSLVALVVARETIPLLLALAPTTLPRAATAAVDGTVLLFATILAAACALLCGLGPSLVAARAPAAGSLGQRDGSSAARSGRARQAFVLAQVALSLTLLAGAALLSKSFARLTSVNPGFSPERVLSIRLTLGKVRYPDAQSAERFFERATAGLKELPGVEAAGAASVLPLSGMNARQDFGIVGRAVGKPSEAPGAQSRWVDAGYFATLGIPIRQGRAFTGSDGPRAAGVAIVDEVLARQLFPGGDAVGSRLRLEDAEERPREAEIVGVVGGVKHFALEEEALGTLYLPVSQIPENMLSLLLNNSNLVVRTTLPPLSAARVVREAIRKIDPDVPTGSLRTMGDLRGAALAGRRFTALLFGLFAFAAAILAGVGLYGTLAQMVAQERRPIGIRLALGASPRDILRHVAGRGLALTLAGIGAGLVLAVSLSRLLSSSLFEVSPADPQAYLLAAVLLLAVSAAACVLPARRAARVDPATALRPE